MTDADWKRQALCRGQANLFYPTGSRAVKALQEALALCLACPVFAECEADDIETEVDVASIFGFRAGLTQEERRERRRALGGVRINRAHAERHDEILVLTARGWSIREIAAAVGVTERSVSRCRSGACSPHLVEVAA